MKIQVCIKDTVCENIIATIKIRNNYGVIQSLKFLILLMSLEHKRATAIAVPIVGWAITIWEAIQKRSHKTIYKTYTKIEATRLRVTTFAIAKLEEQ